MTYAVLRVGTKLTFARRRFGAGQVRLDGKTKTESNPGLQSNVEQAMGEAIMRSLLRGALLVLDVVGPSRPRRAVRRLKLRFRPAVYLEQPQPAGPAGP